MQIGIITYDHPHRKTQDLICRLILMGYSNIELIVLPWVDRKNHVPLYQHRPIDAVRKTAKVIILHDYDWFNKGVTEDIYSTKKGSFYHTKYGKEFKFEGYHEIYPGTLIMRKK
jgi:hypothetical protein